MIQETKNSNKKVIILLVIIVVILSVLCVLFATKTIDLKKDKSKDNTVNNIPEKIEEKTDNESEIVTRYYQYYATPGNSSGANNKYREIELNVDGTARWSFGGSASGGESYKGTYIEDTSKIVLTLERDMVDGSICDDNTSQFSCKTTITLIKNSDNTVTSHYELANDGLSFIYKLVEKTDLNLLK